MISGTGAGVAVDAVFRRDEYSAAPMADLCRRLQLPFPENWANLLDK